MARHRYQKGCLFKRGKKWVLRFREDTLNPDGSLGQSHRSVALGSFENKKEARQAADSYLHQFNSGNRCPQSAITLDQFWREYFEREILPTLKFATIELYRNLAKKHILPALGRQKLCDFSALDIQQFIGQKQRAGYSPQTLAHLRNLVSKIFGTATRWGWMNHNPARGTELPPMERTRHARVLTPTEVRSLDRKLDDPARTIFLVGCLTGLRIGELLALQVGDVDLSRAVLHVRRDVYRGHVGSPKTPGSERQVPLTPKLVAALRHWLKVRRGLSAWLFPSATDTPFRDRNLLRRNVWPVCTTLGIPRFGWHSLRHTFSTYNGNSGVAMPVLQGLLGHSSVQTTMLYTHPLEDAKRQAVENLSRFLFPSVPAREGLTQLGES